MSVIFFSSEELTITLFCDRINSNDIQCFVLFSIINIDVFYFPLQLFTLRGSVLEDAIPNLKTSNSNKTLNTKEVLEYVAPEIQLSW